MNTPATTAVIIIDDHPLFRKGVSQLIALNDQLHLIGEASSGEEGLELARALDPDLILLDLNMKGMGGIETLKALREADLAARILILTVSDAADDLVAAIRAGADGYLLKDMEPERLIQQVRDVLRGDLVISPTLARVLAQALRTAPAAPDVELTERERQVLKMIAGGNSNKMIGRKLGITEGTVKVNVKNLLHKLGLRSRVEAAVWALENERSR